MNSPISPPDMPENNESSEDVLPYVDIQQLESQLQSEGDSTEGGEEDTSTGHCLSWVNWHFFILPGCLHELRSQGKTEEELDSQNFDRFIPKTKLGRQIGVMQYVLHEEGKLYIEELLFIDVVLRRITSFSPNMAGIDRYDEMGVLQLRHGLRRFIEDFFTLSPKKRRNVLLDFKNLGLFSPEISHAIKRLENLVDIPKSKNSSVKSLSESKTERVWPDGLTGRDRNLFMLLSGVESMSPRNQALSVLNYILPEEPSSNIFQENSSEPIRFESGDKERIAGLLKRFPALKNRYPYLLRIIENDIPAENFNADSDNQEHLYNSVLPSTFFLPSVLADPQKESGSRSWFSNRFIKWSVIIAVLCSLIKLTGILYNVLIK